MFSRFQSKFGALWCSLAHQSVMWPAHGHYECRDCGRQFPAFAEAPIEESANRHASRRATQDAASTAFSRA
jgi:hypothetical protein